MEEPELPTADWGEDEPQPAEGAQVPEQPAKKRRLNTVDEVKPQEDVRTPPRVQKVLKQAKTFEDFRKHRVFRYLRAFSGAKDPLGAAITREAKAARLQCELVALDWKRDESLDMTDPEVHKALRREVEQGEFDGMRAGFPCNTFSRARWSDNPGPPPLRSTEEIYGLASNNAEMQELADKGTLMACQSGWLMETQVTSAKERGIPAVATLENPPGDSKCGPAWELPELKESLHKVRAVRVAFNTCAFQSKERTRHFKPAMWAGRLENLQSLGRACRCPAWVYHESLVGKSKAEAAGEYPQELCDEVAKLVVSVWKRILSLEFWRHQMKVRGDEVSELQKKWTLNEMARVKRSTEDDPRGKRARDNNIAEALKAEKVEESAIPSANKELSNKELRERQNENAIGGMRNPDISVQRMFLLRSMGEKIRKTWDEFARAKPDVIDAGEDYGSAEAKLQEKLVAAWDDEVRKLLNLRPRSKLVLKGQDEFVSPLVPDMWRAWAKGSRDPDVHLADFMESGAPLGMEVTIPPSGIFPKAASPEAKILDDAAEFEELRNTVNYKSVAEQREDAAIEIERYIKKGYAVRKNWDWVQKEFGSGTCSRMALIVKSKPDGSTKRRVVIDLKRSSGNDRASVPERIILPRIQ